jgi:N-acetylglucosamine-6-sulfatase
VRYGLGLVVAAALVAVAGAAPAQAEQTQPNVVMVMTDDQRVWDMDAMPLTNRLLADEGTTFTNSITTNPLCCPSRASFLSGQYAHNHGVLDNEWPEGGYEKFDFSNALGVWLQAAGYRTAHIGKQLNEYGVLVRPAQQPIVAPGYDDWFATRDPTTYSMYNYVVQDGPVRRPYGELPEDYQTDVLTGRALEDIRAWAPDDRPFFIHYSTSAPHHELYDAETGPRAAPRHEGSFASRHFDPRPNYDEEDVSDKPSVVRHYDRISAGLADMIAANRRDRLESLQAIDEGVAAIVAELEAAGELDETLIFFTSDNGYLHGEHRLPNQKVVHYEESSRVPLIVRGPGFPAGESRKQLVGNIDLAPTIVEAAGASAGRVMDGESLTRFAEDPAYRRNRTLVIESDFAEVGGTTQLIIPPYHQGVHVYYDAIRTKRFKYVHWFRDVAGNPVDEYELYDLAADPFEMESLHDSPRHAGIEARLARELATFKDCAGADCRRRIRVRPPCLDDVGAIELGASRSDLLLGAGSPRRAGERVWRYCVEGAPAAGAVFSRSGVVRRVFRK